MSERNDYDYFDLDNFDETKSLRYRRNQARQNVTSGNSDEHGRQRQSVSEQYRPAYKKRPNISSGHRPVRRLNKKRIRNRIVIVAAAVLALVIFIIIITSVFKSCTKSTDTENISKETVASTAPDPRAEGGELSAGTFMIPVIKDDSTDGQLTDNLYVWNNAGFELFSGTNDSAQAYAEAVNGFADHFGSTVKVYNMIVPTNTELGLPNRLKKGDAVSNSQSENIKTAYAALSNKIIPINCYNRLLTHNDEYIFFKSDYHWTALGAYYAYTAFAETNNKPVLSLDDCTEDKIDSFTGWYMNIASGLDSDTVSYYNFPYDVSMEVESEAGIVTNYDSPYDENSDSGSGTYSVFIMGNNPRTVLRSSSQSAEKGSKIAVVKDNYGSGFVPYLTYNYDEVHVIDYRYYSGDFIKYCQENNINEVLFLNGVMGANTDEQILLMSNLFSSNQSSEATEPSEDSAQNEYNEY